MNLKSLLFTGICSIAIMTLAGCAALGTKAAHHSLETQTLMSKSIFLSADNTNKTIYVDVHNTTDKDIDLEQQLISNLTSKGYTIANSSSKAHYVLQVNVLQLGQSSKTAAEEMTHSGYGGTAEGAVAGTAIAATSATVSHHNVVAGGLIGAAATTIADNAVKDVVISGITDVKIAEHLSNGKTNVYTTRIGITAEKANLKFKKAKKPIETSLAKSISGIF